MWQLALSLLLAHVLNASHGQEVFQVHKYHRGPWIWMYIKPVEVEVYYESQCSDSKEFIVGQLLPAFARAPHLIIPVFIPYGKAETRETPTGYKFICQHGPSECKGNKIHACAIDLLQEKEIQLKYITCMMSNYDDPELIGQKCAKLYGINWNLILQCSRGTRGSELLAAYGKATEALDPPVSFIPTITLNKSQANQSAILNDLWGEICKLFKKFRPRQCAPWYYRIFG